MVDLLLGKLFNRTSPTFEKVIKFLKELKKSIYVTGLVPGKSAGPFHDLFLQLLAKGILELSVETNEAKNIG